MFIYRNYCVYVWILYGQGDVKCLHVDPVLNVFPNGALRDMEVKYGFSVVDWNSVVGALLNNDGMSVGFAIVGC